LLVNHGRRRQNCAGPSLELGALEGDDAQT
jgi:hypothetical protein